MIKEIAKILENVDVQITFTEHPEGVRSRLIFIPRKKGMRGIIPIEAWGTDDEVNNSIRYELDKFAPDYKENVSPLVAKIVDNNDKKESPKNKIIASLNDDKIAEEMELIETVKETVDKVLEKHDEDNEIKTVLPNAKQLPKLEDIKLEEINAKIEKEKNTIRCAKCELPEDSVEVGECPYMDCPNGKAKDFTESGVNIKPLTPEENRLRSAMVKEEVKAITPQEAFSDNPIVDMTNVNEEKIQNAPKLIFADKKEVDLGCYDPEYGHCNSIDNEGENDDLPRALQDVEEEEISEQEQMEIDSRNAALNKAQPFTAPTFNF